MSITKMMEEKSDSGAPRFSAVTFAGVSQISSGMTVLSADGWSMYLGSNSRLAHSTWCFTIRIVVSK